MKTVERYIYLVIIIVLVGVIASGVTYIVMKSDDSNNVNDTANDNNNVNNKEEEKITDGIKLLKTYNSNDKIIEEFEVVLNGISKTIKIEFSSEKFDDNEDFLFPYRTTGKMGTKEVFIVDSENKDFKAESIKKNFNEQNFIIIKGKDNKNYLLMIVIDKRFDVLDTVELLVFNDKFEIISKNLISENDSPDMEAHDGFVINNYNGNIPCEFNNNHNPLYSRSIATYIEDGFNITRQFAKIENDKIYFLYPKINKTIDGFPDENNFGNLEERVYTISNNKLEYKIINTYKITGLCQQI